MEPTRFSEAHIEGHAGEVDKIAKNIASCAAGLNKHIQSLRAVITDHLWVDANFAEPATELLGKTLQTAKALLARAKECANGFRSLPRKIGINSDANPVEEPGEPTDNEGEE